MGGSIAAIFAEAPSIIASPWVWIALVAVDVILQIFGLDPMSLLMGAISGLPSYVKTAITGQRLANSQIPLVSALGMHFQNLAKNGHILSDDADLKQYFGPAMKYTTSCLYRYEPTPINASMQDVVFKGYPAKMIEDAYVKDHPATVKLLSEAEFLAINPNHIFPQGFYNHLTKIWNKLYPQPIEKPPPQCPPGFIWDGTQCVPVSISPPTCPVGFHWDATQCVPDVVTPPQCPPGTHWDGTQCVPDVQPPPECPPGSHWDGTKCVPDTTTVTIPPYTGPPP